MESPLKMLLADISGHGNRHLLEIQADLAQTNSLLDEAIDQLTESFTGIAQAVDAFQEAMSTILSSGELERLPVEMDGLLRLGAVNQDLALHINAAVTGLQFEDITSQLIARVTRRVEGLRELLDCLGNAALEELESGGENSGKTVLLEEMVKRIRAKSLLIDDQLRKAVEQRHMESGDMELF